MLDRRETFAALAGLGVGSVTFQRALAAQAPAKITAEMVKQAEWVAGITLSDDDRKSVAAALSRSASGIEAMRKLPLANHVAPAFHFAVEPHKPAGPRGTVTIAPADVEKPADLAFASVTTLGHLVRTKKVSSVELTNFFLARLKQFDPKLKFVIALTEELALKQAKAADAEIAAGKYRGPLHGIPWGAKDLIAVPGYKTTWGAERYKEQTLDDTATVAKRLEAAGAVLVAKLTLGALANNDVWFGGMTRNPWNPEQGSSGSSAGSASATAAGCVPFALGSETLGSIVSPSTRCGATGLRPTFGRVSRHGCMALCWTMDKIGPLTRSAEDCAIVLGAIHGADGKDPTAVDRPFDWPHPKPLSEIRVGYFESTPKADVEVLRKLGVKLVPVKLPADLPVQAAVLTVLRAESSAAFDELPRGGIRDGYGSLWITSFQEGEFVSAVEYIRANRVRTLMMRQMAELFETVDVYAGGNDLFMTNLTGHPTVCLPNGFRKSKDIETPTALTFTGKLFGEAALLTVAAAYQQATGHHLRKPDLKPET